MSSSQALVPPFTREIALKKVKTAQKLWNTKSPVNVAKAYTSDSTWRNREDFFSGSQAIETFLTKKWEKEHNYRLRKELFAFDQNKIAVEFWYEYTSTPSTDGQWFRTYGLEHWVFDEAGKMSSRQMSGNTIAIKEDERWFTDENRIDDVVIPDGHISQS